MFRRRRRGSAGRLRRRFGRRRIMKRRRSRRVRGLRIGYRL